MQAMLRWSGGRCRFHRPHSTAIRRKRLHL